MREIDTVDRQIIAKMQGDFPLCERPYAQVAEQLGIAEDELLERAFVLAALAVPEERYEEVTSLVNALPQVAHNYRREHALNMWFVLATETQDGIAQAVALIERNTGLPVYAFPKEQEYFVEMKLEARI